MSDVLGVVGANEIAPEDLTSIALTGATLPEPVLLPPETPAAPETPAPAKGAEPAAPEPTPDGTLKSLKDLLVEQGKLLAAPLQPTPPAPQPVAQPTPPADPLAATKALLSHPDPEIQALAKAQIEQADRTARIEAENARLRAEAEQRRSAEMDSALAQEERQFLKDFPSITAADLKEAIYPAWNAAIDENPGLEVLTLEEFTARYIGRDALDARRAKSAAAPVNGSVPKPAAPAAPPRPQIVTEAAVGGGPIRREKPDHSTSFDQSEQRFLARLNAGR